MDAGHSKLLLQLQALTEADLKVVRRFLETSLHDRQAPELRLFGLLLQDSSLDDHKKPDKKALFKRLFPDEKGFDERKDKRVRNLMSKLSKLLEEFLVHRELEADPSLRQRLLATAYQKRNAPALFFKEAEAFKSLLSESGQRGADYLAGLAWLHSALYFHPDTARFKANHDGFSAAIESLELSFTLSVLCWHAESISRKRMLNELPKSHYVETALAAARTGFASGHPIIELFLQLVEPAHPPDLEALKKALFDCQHLLNEFEKSLAFKLLINLTIPNANQGAQSDVYALLGLYKAGLERGILHRQDAMDTLRFTNIAITAAGAGDFEWTAWFIEKYKPFLSRKDREKAALLCEAYLHYYTAVRNGRRPEDFAKALACLIQIKRADEVIELQARSLQIRVNYEACAFTDFPDEAPAMLALANYFKEYLLRELHLSDDVKRSFLNFLALFKDLVNLKAGLAATKASQVQRFKQKLGQAGPVRLKHWLVEMAAEL